LIFFSRQIDAATAFDQLSPVKPCLEPLLSGQSITVYKPPKETAMSKLGDIINRLRQRLADLISIPTKRRMRAVQLRLDPHLCYEQVLVAVMREVRHAAAEKRTVIRLIRIPRAHPEFHPRGNSLQTLCGLSAMYRCAAEALNLRVEIFELKMVEEGRRRRYGLPEAVEWSYKDNCGRNSPSHFDLIARLS
jgi:hypothetical protein